LEFNVPALRLICVLEEQVQTPGTRLLSLAIHKDQIVAEAKKLRLGGNERLDRSLANASLAHVH
jgi:hypothetical protein